MKLCILLMSALGIMACSGGQSNQDLIPEHQFVKYYADVLVLQEEAGIRGMDSDWVKFRTDSLKKIYRIQPNQIETTLGNYKKDVITWKRFYEKVSQRLDSIQQSELPKLPH